jgi:hypothetical protein
VASSFNIELISCQKITGWTTRTPEYILTWSSLRKKAAAGDAGSSQTHKEVAIATSVQRKRRIYTTYFIFHVASRAL